MGRKLKQETAIVQDFECESDSLTTLKHMIQVAFLRDKKASHYFITANTLYLLWHEKDLGDKIQKLPYELTSENAFPFVQSWLEENFKPMSDVGFKIRSGQFCDGAVLTVKPVTIHYSK